MAEVKAYTPQTHSISTGQVLHCPYDFEKGRLIVKEMTDLLVLDLVDKGFVTDQIVLTVGYDVENLTDPERRKNYKGALTIDRYGRKVPKHAHGTANLNSQTSSTKLIMDAVTELYDTIVDNSLLIRRINITANKLSNESFGVGKKGAEQLNLFTDYEARKREEKSLEKEKQIQKAVLKIKKQYGKNAVVKGMNLEEGATTISRNKQIGGHKA